MLCCVWQGLFLDADFYRAEHQVASSELEDLKGITKVRQRVLTLRNYPDSATGTKTTET